MHGLCRTAAEHEQSRLVAQAFADFDTLKQEPIRKAKVESASVICRVIHSWLTRRATNGSARIDVAHRCHIDDCGTSITGIGGIGFLYGCYTSGVVHACLPSTHICTWTDPKDSMNHCSFSGAQVSCWFTPHEEIPSSTRTHRIKVQKMNCNGDYLMMMAGKNVGVLIPYANKSDRKYSDTTRGYVLNHDHEESILEKTERLVKKDQARNHGKLSLHKVLFGGSVESAVFHPDGKDRTTEVEDAALYERKRAELTDADFVECKDFSRDSISETSIYGAEHLSSATSAEGGAEKDRFGDDGTGMYNGGGMGECYFIGSGETTSVTIRFNQSPGDEANQITSTIVTTVDDELLRILEPVTVTTASAEGKGVIPGRAARRETSRAPAASTSDDPCDVAVEGARGEHKNEGPLEGPKGITINSLKLLKTPSLSLPITITGGDRPVSHYSTDISRHSNANLSGIPDSDKASSGRSMAFANDAQRVQEDAESTYEEIKVMTDLQRKKRGRKKNTRISSSTGKSNVRDWLSSSGTVVRVKRGRTDDQGILSDGYYDDMHNSSNRFKFSSILDIVQSTTEEAQSSLPDRCKGDWTSTSSLLKRVLNKNTAGKYSERDQLASSAPADNTRPETSLQISMGTMFPQIASGMSSGITNMMYGSTPTPKRTPATPGVVGIAGTPRPNLTHGGSVDFKKTPASPFVTNVALLSRKNKSRKRKRTPYGGDDQSEEEVVFADEVNESTRRRRKDIIRKKEWIKKQAKACSDIIFDFVFERGPRISVASLEREMKETKAKNEIHGYVNNRLMKKDPETGKHTPELPNLVHVMILWENYGVVARTEYPKFDREKSGALKNVIMRLYTFIHVVVEHQMGSHGGGGNENTHFKMQVKFIDFVGGALYLMAHDGLEISGDMVIPSDQWLARFLPPIHHLDLISNHTNQGIMRRRGKKWKNSKTCYKFSSSRSYASTGKSSLSENTRVRFTRTRKYVDFGKDSWRKYSSSGVKEGKVYIKDCLRRYAGPANVNQIHDYLMGEEEIDILVPRIDLHLLL